MSRKEAAPRVPARYALIIGIFHGFSQPLQRPFIDVSGRMPNTSAVPFDHRISDEFEPCGSSFTSPLIIIILVNLRRVEAANAIECLLQLFVESI